MAHIAFFSHNLPYLPFGSFDPNNSKMLVDSEDKVISDSVIRIMFDYPFHRPTLLKFKSPNGYTVGGLAKLIFNTYKQLFSVCKKSRCSIEMFNVWKGYKLSELKLYSLYKNSITGYYLLEISR